MPSALGGEQCGWRGSTAARIAITVFRSDEEDGAPPRHAAAEPTAGTYDVFGQATQRLSSASK
eukprot:2532295-Prymnesium_polylepis.1